MFSSFQKEQSSWMPLRRRKKLQVISLTLPSNRRGIIVYIEYQSACLFVGIGSPSSSPKASVPSPLDPNGGSNTRLRVRRGRGTLFGRLDRKPGTLYTYSLRPSQPSPRVAFAKTFNSMHCSPIAANWRGVLTVVENLLFCECRALYHK